MKVYIPSPGETVQQIFRRMLISGRQNSIAYLLLTDRVLLAKRNTTLRDLGRACRGEPSIARLDPEAEQLFFIFWEALEKRKEFDKITPPAERQTNHEWLAVNRALRSAYQSLGLGNRVTNRIVMHYATATKTTRSTF